jgi:antirestriction protein ArdC
MNRTDTTSRTDSRGHKASRVPRDHNQEVTDRIIAALEAGTPPWRRPWDPDKAGGPAMPRNAATGQRYRGINVLTLGMSALAFSSGDPRWATYKQAEDKGWQVRKGERGTTGFFFKKLELRDDSKPDDSEDSVRRIPLLRAFHLLHASQIDGVPDYIPPTIEEAPWRAPEAAEIIIANSGAVIRFGGERAFYSPSTDHIQMPPQSAFATASGFCGTMIHELSHWSGAKARLNRDLRNHFGSHDYAREELRAEIGQMMICGELGIAVSDSDFSNNAAYVASWLEKLRSDRKEIFRAAADAQRIADYLLAFHPDYAASNWESPQTEPDGTVPAADDGDASLAPETMPEAA